MIPVTVEPLSKATLRTVFPLMRAAMPELVLAQWLRFARRVLRPGHKPISGVLVARRAGSAFPCGSVYYRQDRTLADTPVLTAEHFIAPSLVGETEVLAALLAALEVKAAETGCTMVRSVVAGHAAELGLFQLAGHGVDGVVLEKPVAMASVPTLRPGTCPERPNPSPRSRASRGSAAGRGRRTDP